MINCKNIRGRRAILNTFLITTASTRRLKWPHQIIARIYWEKLWVNCLRKSKRTAVTTEADKNNQMRALSIRELNNFRLQLLIFIFQCQNILILSNDHKKRIKRKWAWYWRRIALFYLSTSFTFSRHSKGGKKRRKIILKTNKFITLILGCEQQNWVQRDEMKKKHTKERMQ